MGELLTTRQLQDLLKVDRTTIYRMVQSRQLPAIRVGNQWRFPREAVEKWLGGQVLLSADEPASHATREERVDAAPQVRQLFPLGCVQQILDAFADAFGVMLLLTDMEGNLILEPSNPCGLYAAIDAHPAAHRRCIELWLDLAQDPTLQPRFIPSHLGLLCARGLVRVGSELKAMVIMGGIAPQQWPPTDEQIEAICRELGLPTEVYRAHVHEVHRLSPEEQRKILPFVQRIADILSHIATERHTVMQQLKRIAELAVL
ncbi:MAG: hypothetical protein Kow0047_24490 [Anaerolineae bacterium]